MNEKIEGFAPEHQLKWGQNNDLPLNCVAICLLCCVPFRSFGFALGRPTTASYSSSILAWHCDCLLRWSAPGFFCCPDLPVSFPPVCSILRSVYSKSQRQQKASSARARANKNPSFKEFKELFGRPQGFLLNIRTQCGRTANRRVRETVDLLPGWKIPLAH